MVLALQNLSLHRVLHIIPKDLLELVFIVTAARRAISDITARLFAMCPAWAAAAC